MGRLIALARDFRFRIWLVTTLPTGIIFMIFAACLRLAVQMRLPPQTPLEGVFPGRYILWGTVAAMGVATVSSTIFVTRQVRALSAIGRMARELTKGHYGARVQERPLDSDLLRSLADDVNTVAESLERVERLRRELVANLAHEIRTPLTNLQGYLEALRDGVLTPNQEALTSVHEEVMRLVRLVDALHQLARADALRQQPPVRMPTNVDALVEQLIRVMRPAAEARRIKVLVDLGAKGRTFPVHADSIAQVLRNVLRNAAQYTDEGGVIRVQTTTVADMYTFTSINSGVGIAPEDLPFVFQRFYRTDKAQQRVGGGVGLGLAIAKELVEAHDGRIGVDSKAGWTTLWFELPLGESARGT